MMHSHNFVCSPPLQMEKTIVALRERMEKQQAEAAELKAKYNLQDT